MVKRGRGSTGEATLLGRFERACLLVEAGCKMGVGKIALASGALNELALERAKIEKVAQERHDQVRRDQQEESEHLKIQYLLTKIGRALGYDVHVAANDRGRVYDGQDLSVLTVDSFPDTGLPNEVAQTVSLIDVLWLDAGTGRVVCAFEVEKSTSIYSGILRLFDLAQSLEDASPQLFLIAPDSREKEVQAQLRRPAFLPLGDHALRYILFSKLCEHCDGICMFGDDHRALLKIARTRDSQLHGRSYSPRSVSATFPRTACQAG